MFREKKQILKRLTLFISLLLSGHIYSQSKDSQIFQYLNVDLGVGSIYNDNILNYSDYYLTKFINKQDSGRFHINTSDGLVWDQSVKIAPVFQFFGKNKTILEGNFSRQSFINNPIKNWNKIDFGIKQYFLWKTNFGFSYTYIPVFYIRHYRDDDLKDVYGYTPETFQPFGFAKNDYGIFIEKAFFKHNFTRLRLSFNDEQYYYNKYFTEYDCNNKNYGISLYQSIRDKIKFKLGYTFTVSNAKGFDELSEIKENSDDSDPSYKADAYRATIKYPLPRIFNKVHTIGVDAEYERSCYTSRHYLQTDRLHAGRVDDFYKMEVNYEIKLLKPLTVSCFYKWYKRDADTRADANKEYVSQEKDFTQQQFGLELTYRFKNTRFKRSDSKQNNE